MSTVAERFRGYALSNSYSQYSGMCILLNRGDEGDDELLEEISKYMRELGSNDGQYLLDIVIAEGWDITCKDIYLDWVNRPFPENAETFQVGNQVHWNGLFGEVIRLEEGDVYPVIVQFVGVANEEYFTINGRYHSGGKRELELVK